MHHTRLRLGVVVTELALTSVDESSTSEVLSQLESQYCPSALFNLSINECLICEPTVQASERFIPGELIVATGELGLLKASSCNISPILDSMLKAKLARTLEYASKMECPISYRNRKEETNITTKCLPKISHLE